jgi:signal transduction histidine kinase
LNLTEQDRDQPDRWTDEIFRCLLTPSVPQDSVAAAAAAWLVVGKADSATVILFTSASGFVMASASRDSSGQLEISAGSGQHSIGALFAGDQLMGLVTGSSLSRNADTYVWPGRLAACLVDGREHQKTPAADVVSKILANAQSQQTRIPNADHLESMAEFAAGAGHEINNPLGSIVGQTQLLLKQEEQTNRRQALATIGSQAWRIRDMIGDCMLFARPPAAELQDCELSDLVRQASLKTVSSLEQLPDCLRFDLPSMPLSGHIDPSQIRTLVNHLVRNAIEGSRNAANGVNISIALETEKNAIILTIEDQGVGIIDELQQRHLFDPFYSGRQAGRGIGFGLPVCWQIARNHGGLILHEDPDDGGVRFVVVLPRSRQN